MSHVEQLQRILDEPLSYLHPQRLSLPAGFEGFETLDQLNRIVSEGCATEGLRPLVPLSGMARQWVRLWEQLPYIARLMGAHRLMPDLAQGAGLLRLPLSLRRFAGYHLGPRSGLPTECSPVSMEHVEAAGLHALWSWQEQVPPMLLERLILQFAEPVVRLRNQWPATKPDTALFFLAVQHARLYPNPD